MSRAEPGAASVAAEALHWRGTVVPGVHLLGDRVDVVVQLAAAEHERRVLAGERAFIEVKTLTQRLEQEPAFREWPPVQVVGVIARRAQWSSARRVARGYHAFGPATAVVPPPAAARTLTAIEADYVGVGLVTVDGDEAQVLVPPPAWQAPTWTWVRRLGEETIYARMLKLDLGPNAGDSNL